MRSAKTPIVTILLVAAPDDDRTRLVESLLRNGFDVHCADSKSTCIHLIRQIAPALVVMDRELPDGDGWETVRALKSSSAMRIPFVAITADASRRQVERALVIGCDAILVKPFEADALLRQIRRLLRIVSESGA
jgi:DNA-binding response OmpR family regulator